MALTRRSLLVAAAAAALLAACGPSSSQIQEAREARYQGSRAEVFLAVNNALAKEQPIDKVDADTTALLTVGRWHEADGTYEDKTLGEDDMVSVRDGSTFVAFLVMVVGDAPPYQILVEPQVRQYRTGYSALYTLKPDDPQMPGWVKGKTDDLQLALFKRLRKWVAPPAGGGAPSSTPSPQPSPQ